MAEEVLGAVSFINGYFTLVDGLVAGLEHYLAEDVVLDWFGTIIEGRSKVTDFMKYQKSATRHIFDKEITPVMAIAYHKQSQRRKYRPTESASESLTSGGYKRKYHSEIAMPSCGVQMDVEGFLPVVDVDSELDMSRLQLQAHSLDAVTPKRARRSLTSSPDSEDHLITPETILEALEDMPPQSWNAVQQKIYDLLMLETAEVSAESEQPEQAPVHAVKSVKYVEACGNIEFAKIVSVKQIRREIRKRYCRLQVAYSPKNDSSYSSSPENALENEHERPMDLDSSRDDGNGAFPTEKHDRSACKQFLECFELQMKEEIPDNNNLITPKCFRKTETETDLPDTAVSPKGDCRGFSFNYLIHLIVYESNTKCALNLSHEFDEIDVSEANLTI